jgi:hydroxypyruvate reductase
LSDCFISGGEPTVRLVAESQRGLGGRNQQLVLAVICRLFSDATWLAAVRENPDACRFAFLSGGTDGEDGPTDAAGAFFDGHMLHQVARSGIDPNDSRKRNDAYHFFERFDALIKTGPTGTNVCDVRVLVKR